MGPAVWQEQGCGQEGPSLRLCPGFQARPSLYQEIKGIKGSDVSLAPRFCGFRGQESPALGTSPRPRRRGLWLEGRHTR